MKIVFMGTPDFAVMSLISIIRAGHDVAAVFTQPDKPKNRGQRISESPVKKCAASMGIKICQPVSLRKGDDAKESIGLLKSLSPDCIVVAAYGQILPCEILDLPKYGCINVHASLLPLYRGASPINSCILNGSSESGVTIMKMAEGLDTGDVMLFEKTDIPFNMTASRLHDILMNMGADLVVKALEKLENGTAVFTPQDDRKSTYAPMINKKDCLIDWHRPSKELYNMIRGLSESPGAYTFLKEKRLKIFFAKISEIKSFDKPGTIIYIWSKDFKVLCGAGALTLTDIQLEGSARMSAENFLRGKKLTAGMVLGGGNNEDN
ncbi:MAG: methionyl-tRNA formyltransferase [Eubacterium sp.]|nr:methionyl-tRNA formyltransferase [Eubacterium sp.]